MALTKSGTGTLTLSGSNNYGGATSITAGALNIQNDGALGISHPTSGVTVSSGAALQLSNNITTSTAVSLSLNGTGVAASPNGALENVSSSNTYTGLVTLTGNTTIGSMRAHSPSPTPARSTEPRPALDSR